MLFDMPKHPMSAQQALGLAGANANAVNAETSEEAAGYILGDKDGKGRKHLLDQAYKELIWGIYRIKEWERRYRLAFGIIADFEKLIVLPTRLLNHSLIVDAGQLHMRTIMHKCADIFGCKLTGTAWDEEVHAYGLPAGTLMSHFVERFCDSWQDQGESGPKGKWIASTLTLPQSENGKSPKPFCKRDLELSRCVSLREYLLSLIFSWKKAVEEGKARQWISPHKGYKVWCLGSYGRSLTSGNSFYPVVSWIDGHMRIDCSYADCHDAKTGTLYVYRTNP